MTTRLRNGYLGLQWISIQQKDDKSKLFDSIRSSITSLWTARAIAKSSYLPYICLVGLGSVYSAILRTAGHMWNIPSWLDGITTRPLKAIFDIDRLQLLFNMSLLLGNVVGALSLSLISELTLKMVLGVNLIGRRIFLLQNAQQARSLTGDELDAEMMSFRESNARKRMTDAITSETMGGIAYKQKERTDQVMQIAKAALEASVGYVDSSFFTDARLEVMKKMNLNNSSRGM